VAPEIVLATRFGTSSAEPARVAANLARQVGGHITVLYVATELEAVELGAAEAGIDPSAERARIEARIHAELKTFAAEYLAGLAVGVRVVEGHVAERVTQAAAELNADYIVVGTRGRGQLARLILGDTTHSILQHAPCPVVVVPLHPPADTGQAR
jgi:nucleotide-binding universal stress UspA family protein